MNMDGEQQRILELVQSGKVTPEEGERLLASLEQRSRGRRQCPFCAVSVLEPFSPKECSWQSLKHVVYPGHGKVILWDNNFLASPYWRDILGELRERELAVDFNQGAVTHSH